MAPSGPPPYTQKQIDNMISPAEKLRARAELSSYVARLKKEQELKLAAGSGYGSVSGYNYFQRPAPAPKRGGFTYGGGGNSYHPYQRPPSHVAQKFKNKSVTFNNTTDLSGTAVQEGQAPAPASGGVPAAHLIQANHQRTETKTLCPAFTSTGVCSRHGCWYLHEPTKQALCKRWLFKGSCPKGDLCALTHEPSSHNTPTCLHFQDGHCNNDECRFAHIRINPAAPVCEAFGRVGYCGKGDQCADFHAYECPDFSNKGACPLGDKCQLRHVYRAARMRKASRRSSEGPSSPCNGAEDNATVVPGQRVLNYEGDDTDKPHQFTQQVDFVPFDADE